jgi:hypothetical protein
LEAGETAVGTRLFAFGLALACLSMEADACTCGREPLEVVYEKSAQVFIAEVVKVKKSKTKPRHEETEVYEAVLKPTRMLKGRNPGSIRIKYEVAYAPKTIDGEETIIAGGCYSDYAIGREYVILTNPGESLDWQDWCSSRIHTSSRIRMDYLESLGK